MEWLGWWKDQAVYIVGIDGVAVGLFVPFEAVEAELCREDLLSRLANVFGLDGLEAVFEGTGDDGDVLVLRKSI